MLDVSDEALLAGFATGDPNAAVGFVRRFKAQVFGLAVSITNDHADADEVAQDAFLRAWRYADSFDARRGSVSGWLLGITRNVAIDRVRVTRTRREWLALEHPDAPLFALIAGDGKDGAEATADRNDDVARIAPVLRALPDAQREALVAVTLRGLTTREYAVAADIPLGTAKTRVRLGLRKLRNRLEVPAQ